MAMTFVQWVDRQSWVHVIIRTLRLRALMSRLLQIWPVSRTFSSGTKVRVADLESFYLSDEIFKRETYRRTLALAGEVHTVMDIGCNVGYFCAYLHHFYRRSDFSGIGMDANPIVLKKAAANLELNGLTGIKLVQGLAGGDEEKGTQDFYLYASHLGSSQFLQAETGRALKGDWTRISVPVLKPSQLWQKAYGDISIDLLKIDIEGSEGKLLVTDPALFSKARCIVLEWHKWLVQEDELFRPLLALGFSRREVMETGPTTELWFFSRE